MFYILTLIQSAPRNAALQVVLGILTLTAPIQGQVLSDEDDQTILMRLSLSRYDVQELAIPDRPISSFTISLNLDGDIVELELAPHSVRSDGFRVRTRDADGKTHPYPLPAPTTYRGWIRQQAGSIAAASVINGQLRARIVDGDSVLVIQPLDKVLPKAGRNQYVLFHRTDEIALDFKCGAELPPPHEQALAGQNSFIGAVGCENIAEIAFEADVEFYVLNGSDVVATVADIESIVNGMNVIFISDFQIIHTIAEIIVQTVEPDLLESTDPITLLNEFRTLWSAEHSPGSSDPIDRDIAHLMTGKSLVGFIGYAWLGTMCADQSTGFGYSLSRSRRTSNYNGRVALASHELGHNWSAQHCDLDADCGIMCSIIGGCNGIINHFGSSSIVGISAYRDTLACLGILPPAVGPDCNTNCIEDAIDISVGSSQDCNTNDIPDECDLNPIYSQNSGSLSPIGLGSDAIFIFIDPPVRISDVTFNFTASADLDTVFTSVEVFLDTVLIGEIFKSTGTACANPPDEDQIILSQAFFDSIVGSGDAEILMIASSSDPFACGGASFITVNMSYGTPSLFDTNENGIIDSCECLADCAAGTSDGNVNVTDLLALLANWGGSPTNCDIAPSGGDGTVNVTDLLALLAAWGACP